MEIKKYYLISSLAELLATNLTILEGNAGVETAEIAMFE